MPKVFTSKTQRTGEIGEHVACRYLQGKGFSILERNYTKKWGEIDIVAQKGKITHFIEVKSKIVEIITFPEDCPRDGYRPEDNMHPWKLKRLHRTVQTYLLEKSIERDWKFDLITVYISSDLKNARVEILEDICI